PRGTGPSTSFARRESADRGGVASGVAVSADGTPVTCSDFTEALGAGRAVALSLGEPPLGPWSALTFGGASVPSAVARATPDPRAASSGRAAVSPGGARRPRRPAVGRSEGAVRPRG